MKCDKRLVLTPWLVGRTGSGKVAYSVSHVSELLPKRRTEFFDIVTASLHLHRRQCVL